LIESVYSGVVDRVAVAGLAEVVGGAATDGDEVSRMILMHAGGSLGRLAQAVHRRVFADSEASVSLALVGSLWEAGSSLTDVFERSVYRFAPNAVISHAAAHPAEGAARMALDLLVGPATSNTGGA
jgi:N-acetylglucosamine kinase-like BadF-type ATPase